MTGLSKYQPTGAARRGRRAGVMVYPAREAGSETGPGLYVKHLLEETSDVKEGCRAEDFAKCAAIQKSLAETAGHWLAVTESGGPEGGEAYSVTEHLVSLAAAAGEDGCHFNERDLYSIVVSVLNGLLELKKEYDRPHGAISSSNVFLRNPDAVAETGAMLADPAPEGEVDPKDGWRADLTAVGRLIYSSVCGVPFDQVDPGQIDLNERPPAWSRLGARAKGWWALCTSLLATDPREDLTLDGVLLRLKKLDRGRSRKGWVAAGVLAVALCFFAIPWGRGLATGAARSVIRAIFPGESDGGREPLRAAPDDWVRLCEDYQWLERLSGSLKNNGPLYRKDPDSHFTRERGVEQRLSSLMADSTLDPRTIAGEPGAELTVIKDKPPDPKTRPDAPTMTVAALDKIATVKAMLEPYSKQRNPAGWPLLQRIEGLSALNRADGPERGRLSEYLDELVLRDGPEHSGPPSVEGIERVLGEVDPGRLELIEREWPELAERCRRIRRFGVVFGSKLLPSFKSCVDNKLQSSDDLAMLADNVDVMSQLARSLIDFVEKEQANVYWQDFINTTEPEKANLNWHLFSTWLEKAQQHRRLAPEENPCKDPKEWAAGLEEIETVIAELPKEASGQTEVLQSELRRVKWHVEKMRRVLPIGKNRGELVRLARNNDEDLKKLKLAALNCRRKFDSGWLGDFEKLKQQWAYPELVVGSDAINKEWAKRIGRLFETPPDTLAAGDDAAKRLQVFLVALDERTPKGLEDLPGACSWYDVLREELRNQREQALNALLKLLPAEPPVPDQSFPQMQQTDRFAKKQKEYEEYYRKVRALAVDFARIESGLDALYLLGDRPQDASKTIGELLAQWEQQEFLGMGAALKPVLDRIEQLRHIETLGTADELVQTVTGPDRGGPDGILAAWRRLGALDLDPAWPAQRKQVMQELDMRDAIKAALAAPKTAWNPSIDKELVQQGTQRWANYFESVSKTAKQEDIAFAFTVREKFGVGPELAYNTMVHALARWSQATPLPDDDQVRGRIEAFASRVEGLEGISARPPAAQLLEALKQVPDAGEPEGPAGSAIGQCWTVKAVEGGECLEYRWAERQHTLRFLRIGPEDGAPRPCYVSTTEVSIGLFGDVLRQAGGRALEDMKSVLGRFASGTRVMLPGPSGWRWQDGEGVQYDQEWLRIPPSVSGSSERVLYYPEGQPSPPDHSHPMQYVGPGPAVYFARLLGCRLLSPAEWQAALRVSMARDPVNAVNRRDKTWQDQWNFTDVFRRKIEEKFKGGPPPRLPDWPDDGTFVPEELQGNVSRKESVGRSTEDTLWFWPVNDGCKDGLPNLIGNVAEFVHESAPEMEGIAPLSYPSVAEFLASHPDGLGIIGASALSPPEIEYNRPYKLRWDAEPKGYSDVGIRLAFTAERESCLVKLKRLMQNRAAYLLGGNSRP